MMMVLCVWLAHTCLQHYDEVDCFFFSLLDLYSDMYGTVLGPATLLFAEAVYDLHLHLPI